MKPSIAQEDLERFVAGLLEDGPLLERLRADLESSESSVSLYLARIAKDAQTAFEIDWPNLLREETMCDYSSLLRCFGMRLSNPEPVHRDWYIYWYICGRRFFSNTQRVDLRWSAEEWELALQRMIEGYAEAVVGIERQPEPINAIEADIYDAILDVLSELIVLFRREKVQDQLARLPDMFLLDVIDVFFEWNPRWNVPGSAGALLFPYPPAFQKLLAYTYVRANRVFAARDLEANWQELLLAIEGCLSSRGID